VIYIDDESLIGGKSPAKAGLSLQEEPSNVTFTFDEYETSVKIGCRWQRWASNGHRDSTLDSLFQSLEPEVVQPAAAKLRSARPSSIIVIYIGANTWLSRCCVRAKDVTFWRQRSCGERESHAQA
jgi:hypothetical protein